MMRRAAVVASAFVVLLVGGRRATPAPDPAGRTFAGRIVGPDGAPVTGARVELVEGHWRPEEGEWFDEHREGTVRREIGTLASSATGALAEVPNLREASAGDVGWDFVPRVAEVARLQTPYAEARSEARSEFWRIPLPAPSRRFQTSGRVPREMSAGALSRL